MTKWTRDCNGDGVVDCDDFAAIHKLGPHMCREESVTSTDYWKAFDKCSAATTGSGVIQPRNLAGRSIAPDSDASRAESIPRETVAPRSSNDLADPFDGTRDPADSSLFNNVPPIGSLRDNSISLPEVAKPVGVSLPTPPSRLMEPTPPIVTPRPDLPLITPRRSLATHLVANFRRGRLLATTEKPKVEISSECLACICEASSQCNPDTGCSLSQNGAQVCGPYQFDRNYWSASGSGSADFERCALDQDCAEDAVRSYTAKNTLDCNDDGNIDCLDFAAIHRAGPKACNSQWLIDSTYWSDFQNCYGFGR
ncbi:Lysozyme [Halotydeus destructor]|nr:Lysozyme [Halotydeus destructor]